jgi:multidrug transporter EmrE-like cation transporter
MNKISKQVVVKKITDEFKEFVIIAVYLYVFFAALIYLKAAILHANGIAYAHFGLAAAKALICAKFVLVGQALHLGEQHKNRPLIWPVLYKSAVFLVFLLVLDALEEILVGLIHHRAIAQSIAEVGGGTLPQLIATSFICLLMLVPFFAFRALGEVVGEDNLLRLFFGGRRKDNA